MKMRVEVACHIGLKRKRMEDAAYPSCGYVGEKQPPFVVAVADGLGGLPHGKEASEAAISAFEDMKPTDMESLKETLAEAERRVEPTGGLTTISVVLVEWDGYTAVWAGDSPIIRIATTGPEIVGGTHRAPDGRITRVLGRGLPEFSVVKIPTIDTLGMVVASDGLTAHLSLGEIWRMFDRPVDDMVALCLQRGGVDNITVIKVSPGKPGGGQ
jgi:serine/threonine protein phosphatase PrpC